MVIGLVASLVLALQELGPPPPPSRPPPLSNGYAVTGVLGQGCDDRRDADGRWSQDQEQAMLAHQRYGFRLISPDFAPRLVILDADGTEMARAEGAAGAQGAQLIFASPPERGERPTYRIRTETVEPGVTGRWRLAVMYNGDLDDPFTTEPSFPPVGTGCAGR